MMQKSEMKEIFHQKIQLLFGNGQKEKEFLIAVLSKQDIEESLLETILDLFDNPSRENIDMILNQCIKIESIDDKKIKIILI